MKRKTNKITYPLIALLTVCSCICCLQTPQLQASAQERTESRYYDDYNNGIATASSSIETITFARAEEEEIRFTYTVPTYFYDSSLANACGPIAGSIVVGYYDKYYENLIPNYTAYYTASGKYRMPDSTYVPALIQDLYTRMRTNVDDVGVSESDCLNGLTAYVQSKSLSISYNSVVSSSFNETAYKNALNAEQPVMLFCNTVTLYNLGADTNEHTELLLQTGNSHIVIAYGYLKIRYYNENDVNFRTETYAEVATGWNTHMSGYLKLNDTSWMDSGYAVDIY